MATLGVTADWFAMPEILDKVREKYPSLLDDDQNEVEEILFDSRLGKLIRIISFNLKGDVESSMNSVLTLLRTKTPEEILDRESRKGKYLYRKYAELEERYRPMLERALEKADSSDKFLVFKYEHQGTSFTSELSNELIARFPDKIVVVARHHDGDYKCSMRSASVRIDEVVEKATEEAGGYGGGHRMSCGGLVPDENFDEFIQTLKDELGKK